MNDKQRRESTDHCAVTPDLYNRGARSIVSHVGTIALAGFLQAGALEGGEGGGVGGSRHSFRGRSVARR